MNHNGSTIALISILVLQIFAMTQSGSTGTSVTGSHDAFAQTSGSGQPSYTLYQNNNEGVSIEYPSDWTYSEKTQSKSMLTYFYPPKDSQTFLELSYDKTTDYTGTDQQILGELSQIISILCSHASIAKNGFTCSDFQYKTGVGNYQGIPTYVMHGKMTETFSDGSAREQDMVQFLIINQNRDYGIFATCPKDKCSNYDNELTYVVNSLKIYSLKTNSNAATQVSSYNIPSWIKNTAKWWSQGAITDDDFVKGLQYLIQQGVIVVATTQVSSQSSHAIPSWVKNTAKWWSEGQVGDSDFVKGMQYLVQNGIIATQTADQGHTAVTDQQGVATFQISGQHVQFSFVDDTTGQPLAGANIVLSVDSQTQSVGTLLVIDPNKHYPVQVIILIPSETRSTTPTSLKNYFVPSASAESEEVVKVAVTTSIRQAGNLLPVSFLHKVHQVGHVVEFFFQAEDGIRYKLVTGVQTCALPISARSTGSRTATGTRSCRRGSPRPAPRRPRGSGSRRRRSPAARTLRSSGSRGDRGGGRGPRRGSRGGSRGSAPAGPCPRRRCGSWTASRASSAWAARAGGGCARRASSPPPRRSGTGKARTAAPTPRPGGPGPPGGARRCPRAHRAGPSHAPGPRARRAP